MDWTALRNYTPPSTIQALAKHDTMTPKAEHLLYVNHPEVNNRTTFNTHCPNNSEQSVVLGCYLGNRQGIYIFDVTDPQLNGVQEVTTAHEMLHQAYERLSSSERTRIDGLLENYQQHGLTDDTIKSQIELYKKSEPGQLDDEMHSLFGTEIASLPAPLEQYYAQYFGNRHTVAGYYASYQAAFTTRKAQIAAYDQQLAAQKPQIDALQKTLDTQNGQLDALKTEMDQKRATGDIAGYNSLVGTYNTLADTFNAGLVNIKTLTSTYNDIVAKRNAIADQEQALQQSLSSNQLPTAAGQ
ncbi:MAG: hypothetical protein ACQR33_02530 [Candidatus Saccharibacteria bacterium]